MREVLKAATLKLFLKDVIDDAEMEVSLRAIIDGHEHMETISHVIFAKTVNAFSGAKCLFVRGPFDEPRPAAKILTAVDLKKIIGEIDDATPMEFCLETTPRPHISPAMPDEGSQYWTGPIHKLELTRSGEKTWWLCAYCRENDMHAFKAGANTKRVGPVYSVQEQFATGR